MDSEKPSKIPKLEFVSVKEEDVDFEKVVVKDEFPDEHNLSGENELPEPIIFEQCKLEVVEPITVESVKSVIDTSSHQRSTEAVIREVTSSVGVADSFSHIEDLSLHALDLMSPYDIKFISSHLPRRTEREIEQRLDDNDFRKKYFLFQRLPSFLFEVLFRNYKDKEQVDCKSLMLVSEKLVTNMICRSVGCQHNQDISQITLDYVGKSRFGIDLKILSEFISTHCPQRWRGHLTMTPKRLEAIFQESRVNFHKYGTTIGYVYSAKESGTGSSGKKDFKNPITLLKSGDLHLKDIHKEALLKIVGALGKADNWDLILDLLQDMFGPIHGLETTSRNKTKNALAHLYCTKMDPERNTSPFTETEEKILIMLYSAFDMHYGKEAIWWVIYRHMQGRSFENCKDHLQRKSTSKLDFTLDNLDSAECPDESIPAVHYYNESFCFALLIIPEMDTSKVDITAKLQYEKRHLVIGTKDEIFLLQCKESARRCYHTGLPTYNFTYKKDKPSSQFEIYLKLTFANGLKRNGNVGSDFDFNDINYSGSDIHTLMAGYEKSRFIVPKERFVSITEHDIKAKK